MSDGVLVLFMTAVGVCLWLTVVGALELLRPTHAQTWLLPQGELLSCEDVHGTDCGLLLSGCGARSVTLECVNAAAHRGATH